MSDLPTFTGILQSMITTHDPDQDIRLYDFTFPHNDDFHEWLPEMLEHPERWRGWISKSKPDALFNQIIHREQIHVRSFPPGAPEHGFGVYLIGDAERHELLYIGKSLANPVPWRLVDHFFPPSNQYRNIASMQNTCWLWNLHIGLEKKLRIVYCDNMRGRLQPEQTEAELRHLFLEQHGDYPRYDGHSKFAREAKSK